ncbi:patatin-like phospholipase family protein [Deinococcus yavapaiensis]|uniref:Patatin-like phospholipase n=1 Tax=Deinococcus yavapaiensis KR-236 TaxID=694435 RepID=A0A318S906_9DEIO|nr:patatin-like phospholipase family protein [Deinococcus yavapaiensis]PYE52062.1 patatin-like phospholipase [Deinococcus yavapaiensis KR-236]
MTPSVNPTLECNLVLEGGVTSGVVYPSLVEELARTYRLRCVGGTSAGAIAASLAAAAELGRQTGQGGFARLLNAADWLATSEVQGGPLNLQRLFQPQATTAATFELLSRANDENRAWTLPLEVMRRQPLAALAGSVPGVALLRSSWRTRDVGGLLWSSGVALAGGVLGALLARASDAKRAFEDNHFGLCNGFTGGVPSSVPPLSAWLTDMLDNVAGRDVNGEPLTFQDLLGEGVDLQMITTCLAHGRPYRLPFAHSDRFYFNEREFRALFPTRVVNFMMRHPRPVKSGDVASARRRGFFAARGVFPLPSAELLPVVVAVRLSLSFPGLISAVPLYGADFTQTASPMGDREPKRAYFSDGGLTSNFPVHLFDPPLPERPTFAVNLRPYPDGRQPHEDEAQNVWMPEGNNKGIQPTWTTVEGLPEFTVNLVDTARNWNDGVYVQAPSYRDRMVHVFMSKHEGGLNLGMTAETVRKLMARGRAAGTLAVQRFEAQGGWNRHRRARLVTLMAAIEEFASAFQKEYDRELEADARSWLDVAASADLGYRLSQSQQKTLMTLINTLKDAAMSSDTSGGTLQDKRTPRPRLALKLRPEV